MMEIKESQDQAGVDGQYFVERHALKRRLKFLNREL